SGKRSTPRRDIESRPAIKVRRTTQVMKIGRRMETSARFIFRSVKFHLRVQGEELGEGPQPAELGEGVIVFEDQHLLQGRSSALLALALVIEFLALGALELGVEFEPLLGFLESGHEILPVAL